MNSVQSSAKKEKRRAAARECEASHLKAGSRRRENDGEASAAPNHVDSGSQLLRRERKREHKKEPR